MKQLSLLDLAFFVAESEGSPKHVAGLMLCKKPPGSPANFGRQLIKELKNHQEPTEPFNLVIQFTGLTGPHWKICQDFNINEHVFYHGSKKTISWREAKDAVAELHEPVLERSRPHWEYHLIDNIEGARFAIYTKVHHAYADGMTMARWLDRCLSKSPDNLRLQPPWTLPQGDEKPVSDNEPILTKTIKNLNNFVWSQVVTAGGLAKLTAQQYLERLGVTHHAVTLAFNASDDTALTGSPSPGRSIATTWMAMDEVKNVCKASRSTLNHVALSCIDGALHRYLEESGNPVNHPITIQMPVNLRSNNGIEGAGNKLGVALVELANPTDDILQRHSEVGHSLHRVKQHIESVRGDSMEQFTVLTGLAGELIEKLRLSNRLPTNGHTLVSNLPGPGGSRYLKGARVEQMYPFSLLVPGLRMNITLFSCGGILNIGIVATKDLEDLDLLARFIREEFDLLSCAVSGA